MKESTKIKYNKLLKDLVKEYGEESIVTRKQILAVIKKQPSEYPHSVYITKNPDHKISRGKFLISTAEDILPVKERVMKNIEMYETKVLPKEVRDDAVKLAKELMEIDEDDTENEFDTELEDYHMIQNDPESLPDIPEFLPQEEIDDMFGGNDLQDILRTL